MEQCGDGLSERDIDGVLRAFEAGDCGTVFSPSMDPALTATIAVWSTLAARSFELSDSTSALPVPQSVVAMVAGQLRWGALDRLLLADGDEEEDAAAENLLSSAKKAPKAIDMHLIITRLLDPCRPSAAGMGLWVIARLIGEDLFPPRALRRRRALRDTLLTSELTQAVGAIGSSNELPASIRPVWAAAVAVILRPNDAELNVMKPLMRVLAACARVCADDDTLAVLLWAVAYYCWPPLPGFIQHVLDENLGGRLIDLMRASNEALAIPAFTVIRNIAAAYSHQTQCVLDWGALDCVGRFLTHERAAIRQQAFGMLASITASTQPFQLSALFDSGLFTYAATAGMRDEDPAVREVVVAMVANATTFATKEVIVHRLAEHGWNVLWYAIENSPYVGALTNALMAIERLLDASQSLAEETQEDDVLRTRFIKEGRGPLLRKLSDRHQHERSRLFRTQIDFLLRRHG